MWIFAVYIILVGLVGYTYRDKFSGVFKENEKVKWIISGLSLFILGASGAGPMLYYGIIANKGIWGLHWLWVGILGSAIIPIVFAPLWQKLNLISDNEIIKVRFSGVGAKSYTNLEPTMLVCWWYRSLLLLTFWSSPGLLKCFMD
ncbi:MAG: hypothetical protein ACXITV_12235 [Luteibaculaceae bacterium]